MTHTYTRPSILALVLLAVGLMFGASTASAEMLAAGAEKKLKPDNTRAIQNYLASDNFITSRQELNRIDADPVPELITLMKARKKSPLVRERAIRSLAQYRDGRVKNALSTHLRRAKLSERELILTAMAYLEAFGESVAEEVSPLLEHEDVQVRANIARGLGLFGGKTGKKATAAHLPNEEDARVRRLIREYNATL